MSAVIGFLLNVLPLIWYLCSKAAPGIFKGITAMAGKTGILAKICGAIVAIYWFVRRLPIAFLKIKLGTGVLGHIFTAIRWILNSMWRFPVIMFLTLVLSQVFPSLLEKIFLIVGALAIKIGVMLFGTVMKSIEDMDNSSELTAIIGDSLDNWPPCLMDVLGYLHIVEDLGMIITTLVLIMTYNLVSSLAFKFIK